MRGSPSCMGKGQGSLAHEGTYKKTSLPGPTLEDPLDICEPIFHQLQLVQDDVELGMELDQDDAPLAHGRRCWRWRWT